MAAKPSAADTRIKTWSPRDHLDDLTDLTVRYAAAKTRRSRQRLFASLYIHLEPLVRKAAGVWEIPNHDPDDLLQEGMAALVSGLLRYSRAHGSARVFAFVLVERCFTDLLRRETAQKRTCPGRPESPEIAPARENDPADQAAEADAQASILARLNALLTPWERGFVRELAAGRTIPSLVDLYTMTESRLRRRRAVIREKLEAGGLSARGFAKLCPDADPSQDSLPAAAAAAPST